MTQSNHPDDRALSSAQFVGETVGSIQFLAVLSHELRCPLASIHNAVRVLGSQTGESPTLRRTQALLERQVQRMIALVENLLDVSRINQGRLSLKLERTDLRTVVIDAVETLEADIEERRHRLAIRVSDVPVWLQADVRRLEQVFVNLIANASKYTNTGGDLTVTVNALDSQAVVRIRDSGIGIAPDALPHVFDLFKQADATDPHSRSGLGIGLALVRDLVELHGGTVTVSSAGHGQGSEFEVRLPLI
jgi:signal transduction histidine kinase